MPFHEIIGNSRYICRKIYAQYAYVSLPKMKISKVWLLSCADTHAEYKNEVREMHAGGTMTVSVGVSDASNFCRKKSECAARIAR